MRKIETIWRGLLYGAVLALSACTGGPLPGSDIVSDTGKVTGEVTDPRNRARVHTELASLYYERGNLGVALEELRIALSADDSYTPAYNVMGLVYMDLRENSQAQESFERALRLSPGDADANHNYGWFLCQTGREAESIRYFLAAIRNPLYSQPQKSYSMAGVCAVKAKNDRDGQDFFERALRIDPNNLGALLNLAQLRFRHGELESARTLIGRFNKLVDPTSESLWLALRIERKLGDKPAETAYASQLSRRFSGSKEYQDMLKGRYE
jgi:type IV pilus assembly protein PilF